MIDNNDRAAALTVALNSMAETLTRTADAVGSSFTCSEADSLAAVLAYSGHVEEAAAFLAGHALGDDEFDADRHHGVTSPARAHEYIRDCFDVLVAETHSDNDARAWPEDDEVDSPEIEAMAAHSALVEQGEYEDIELAHQMTQEAAHHDASLPDGHTGDLNDLLGVEAGQMITARRDADTALANRDGDLLASALERMGVPAEDGPDRLAQTLLAAPPAAQQRQLDQLELLNTLPRDQAAVLAHQRARTGTGLNSATSPPGHPARVAAAAVDRPTATTTQRHQPDLSASVSDVGRRAPNPRSASADRRSTTQR